MRKIVRVALFVIIVMLTSCTAGTALPSNQITPRPYPIPSENMSSRIAVRFQIDRYVKAGDTLVTGSGPSGIPIVIVDVTRMGNVLGNGVIGADNRFAISVPPLEPNIRIGVALGDLAGTGYSTEEFYGDEYKGAGALLVPFVDYFLDTVLVGP